MTLSGFDAQVVERERGPLMYGSRGLTIVSGLGARVRDSEGREYIDCGAMMGVSSVGHAHPHLVAALSEQASRLTACFGSFASDRRAELYRRLHELLPWSRRFFLCNSGTEAVEAAIKLACAVTGRTGLAYVEGGFHGRTLGALALSSRPNHRAPVAAMLPPGRRLRFNDVDDLTGAIDHETAALVVEIVQGEGGVRPVDCEWLHRARNLCRERGAMFVIDEVQTGIGRTGRMFAHEEVGLEPDAVCLAKGLAGGLPIGCTVLGEAMGDPDFGIHGCTFGGGPLVAAAALATLDVIREENLVDRARRMGQLALEFLRTRLAGVVRDVRGRGLMIGIEHRSRVQRHLRSLQQRRVIALAAGPCVLRLLPPLVIGDGDWLIALERVAEVLKG